MKEYLNFQLKGIKIFPVWIVFYILVLIPVAALMKKDWTFVLQMINPLAPVTTFLSLYWVDMSSQPWYNLNFGYTSWPIIFYMVFLICIFYLNKIILKSIHLRQCSLQCNYSFGKYLFIVLSGVFFSVITLGIYLPWLLRNLHRFFINNLSWKETTFYFRGKGKDLLEITLGLLIIPPLCLIFLLSLFIHFGVMEEVIRVIKILPVIIFPFLTILYYFFYYNWRINVSYHHYHIEWHIRFWPSIGKIFLEILFTVITLGIYGPLALIRLYEYFVSKTKGITSEEKIIQFGYDLQWGKDLLTVWGQILLTAISFGFYFPWAYCKVLRHILRKTYVEAFESPHAFSDLETIEALNVELNSAPFN